MTRFNHDFSSRFRILKGGKISLVVSAVLGSAIIASAAPTGGVVTSGSANISQSGNTTNITQSTNKATINWQGFSIASNETVNFIQPNVNSITLNRVVGNERSIIDGALNANGQVWILNSNGILFNSNSKINTAGILATTKNITDADFNAGNYKFTGDSTAGVINMGTIEASDSGYVALLANTVQNDGTIKAYKGTVHLTGASEATINLNGNSIVSLTVNKGVLDALVENKGAVLADGGKIFLTTNAVDEILKGVVNNTGLIEANSLDDISGEVILFAHGGTANVSGTIEAEGGFVETSGKEVNMATGLNIKTKDWLIDPVDFTIAVNGGNMTGTDLSSYLENTDSITIESSQGNTGTNGDIFVNDTISWNTDNDLILSAYRNIYINENITATGTGGKLSLLYGQGSANGGVNDDYTIASGATINLQSGQNFSTQKGSDIANLIDYTVINGADNTAIATALQNMNTNRAGKYALGANVDLTGIAWTPIGPLWGDPHFTGMFDGLGHTIDNLTINDTANQYRGLFGITDNGSEIKNVGLTNVNIIGGHGTGALIGVSQGKVYNVYSTGSVTGLRQVGGLIGNMTGTSSLSQSYSTADISYFVSVGEANEYLGGLVAYNAGSISNSYAAGNVDGTATGGNKGDIIGGFAGDNSGTITNSYFAGTITNGDGGFVGNNLSTISNSFWDKDSGMSTDTSLDASYGLTTAQFADASNFSTWGSTIWSFTDSSVEGYGIASRPFLTNVTTDADKPTMNTLFAGGYGTTVNPYTMTTATHLQNMGNTKVVGEDYYYNLLNDIDLTGVTWTAIGTNTALYNFKGTFDGQNHTIDNLTMNITSGNKGFFGVIGQEGEVKNIGLTNVSMTITAIESVGALAGANQGTISNSYSTGSVGNGNGDNIGGLVGFNNGGNIVDSYSTATVNGGNNVGGLVGENRSSITNSYASGDIEGTTNIGGLVGKNQNPTSTILDSYATGQVDGGALVGGFLGLMNGGTISYSYSTGTVNSTGNSIGGFVGGLDDGSISNSYSTGDVSGGNYVGGFTGYNYLATPISNSYATGHITAITTDSVGGFTGWEDSSGGITNSFWDTQTTGRATDKAGSGTTGKTTAQMKTLSTFSDASWVIEEDSSLSSATYPVFVSNRDNAHIWRIKTLSSNSNGGETGASSTSNENINNIITSITNTNAIQVKAPKVDIVVPKRIGTNTPINTIAGEKVNLVSKPLDNEPTKIVTMGELKSNQDANTPNTNTDIRVALSQDSIIDLVNGGLNLPEGVEQQFYVVEDKRN